MTADPPPDQLTCRRAGCQRVLDPGTDHDGRLHAPQRRYCSRSCKAQQNTADRSALARAVHTWTRQHGALAVLRHLEDGGQQSLDPRPLPALPEPPKPVGDPVLTDVWKPRQGSAVRVLQSEKYLDHQGCPGVWMVLAPHPTRGSWWLTPYDEASRIWAETHPELAKAMARPGKLLLSAAMALPKDVR